MIPNSISTKTPKFLSLSASSQSASPVASHLSDLDDMSADTSHSRADAVGKLSDEERLNLARRILLSSSPGQFDEVLSNLKKLTNLPEDWAEAEAEIRVVHERQTGLSAFGTNRIVAAWNEFFHRRTGPEGCQLGALVRMAFALIYVSDRLLMTLDFEWFFSSQHGVMPYGTAASYKRQRSIFQLAPESDALIWAVHIVGLVQGVLLFAGVAPRFQAFCVFLNIMSFHHHSDMIHDSQDVLCRAWAWLLFFMPLHRFTVWEWWKFRGMSVSQKREIFKNDSWPMWPFRLFQIQLIFIYIGAGFGKLTHEQWQKGIAMYHVIHEDNFFGGIFTPDLIFNRVLPLKIMTWSSLLLECACIFSVWPEATRIPTIIAMILFHLGIDLAMNLNTFQWFMIMGWLTFLVKPSKTVKATRRVRSMKRFLVNLFLISFLIIFSIETSVIKYYVPVSPKALKPWVRSLSKLRNDAKRKIDPLLRTTGTWQQIWNMYSRAIDDKNSRVFALIKYQNGTSADWSQPDWNSMPWWLKKRYHRQMHYFDSVTEKDCRGCRESLCRHLALMHEPGVKSVRLKMRWEKAPPFPPNLGLFDPAKQDMIDGGVKELYKLKWRKKDEKVCEEEGGGVCAKVD